MRQWDRTMPRLTLFRLGSWSGSRRIWYSVFLGNIEDVGAAGAIGTAVTEAETAAAAQIQRVVRLFAMGRGYDEPILIVGDGHGTIHVLDLGGGEADLCGHA